MCPRPRPHRQAGSRVSGRGPPVKGPSEGGGASPPCCPPQEPLPVRSLENPNPRHLKGASLPPPPPTSNLISRPGLSVHGLPPGLAGSGGNTELSLFIK